MPRRQLINLILMLLSLLFFCCEQNIKKRDFIGVYIANEFMKTKDTIVIIDTINYIHKGYRIMDSTRYSDTGLWSYNEKFNCINFYNYCQHSLPIIDIEIDTLKDLFRPSIEKTKGKINLVFGRDAGQFYVKL